MLLGLAAPLLLYAATGSPTAALGLALFTLLGSALLVPETTVFLTLLAASLFGADYIAGQVTGIPFRLSFPGVLALVCLAAGLASVARRRNSFSFSWSALAATALAFAWLVSGALNSPAGVAAMVKHALAGSLPAAGALAGIALLCTTRRGQSAALWGLFGAGMAASASAFAEALLGRNLLLELGMRIGEVGQLAFRPVRFGFTRVSGAFDHPIMLGTFLGLAILVTLELVRQKRLPLAIGIAAIAVQFAAQLLTVSRGPVLATVGVVCLWVLLALPLSRSVRIALAFLMFAAIVGIALNARIADLVRPSATGLGASTQYRLDLTHALLSRLGAASLLGSDSSSEGGLLNDFQSLDSEPAYLLSSQGIVGLALFLALLVGPLARGGAAGLSRRYVWLVALYILVVGATVAFFGLLVPYLFAVLALSWSGPEPYEPERQSASQPLTRV